MHFKTNEEGLIIDFHIERWDLDALGSDMTKEIENHKNKHWEEFIHFALEKKLFLKIRRLFLLSDKHTIYFWESAPIYGESEKEGIKLLIRLDSKRNVNIQYAKFFLCGPKTEEPQLISVFYEAGTVQLLKEAGYKTKDIIIEMSEDDIKDISFAFNITRNNKSSLYILVSKSGDEEKLMEGGLNQVMFTGLGEKTSELNILSEDQLKEIIQSGDLQYIKLLSTFTKDETKQKEISNLLEQVKKLKKKWWKFW